MFRAVPEFVYSRRVIDQRLFQKVLMNSSKITEKLSHLVCFNLLKTKKSYIIEY